MKILSKNNISKILQDHRGTITLESWRYILITVLITWLFIFLIYRTFLSFSLGFLLAFSVMVITYTIRPASHTRLA